MTRTAFVSETSMEEGYINETTLKVVRNGVVFFVKVDKANTFDELIELAEQMYKQACLKKQLVERARKRAIQREIIQLDETTEMEFKSEEAKEFWLRTAAKSPYNNVFLEYARRWAKYMQKLVAEGKSINEIARQTGYPTLSSFNRQFQQFIGCSPSFWKKKYLYRPETHNINSLTDKENASVFRY